MICDPAVAELLGIETEWTTRPTEPFYCRNGSPVITPHPSVDVDTWTWTETSPYSVTPATENTVANATARPLQVALFLDVIVSVDWPSAVVHQAGLVCTYQLSVSTYPTTSPPQPSPPFVTLSRPLAPALTVTLTPESSLDGSDIEDESFSGRAQGFLPPLDPGWTYRMRPSAAWSAIITLSGGSYSAKVSYSALRWNAID